jgi:hypothetical protein
VIFAFAADSSSEFEPPERYVGVHTCRSTFLGLSFLAVACTGAQRGDAQLAGGDEAGAVSGVGDGGLPRDAGERSDSGSSDASRGWAPGDEVDSGGPKAGSVTLRVMSLNVFGHATMPAAAPVYAALIESQDVDIIGIQEGVQDWLLEEPLPTDYSRSEALEAALGECYQR